jgi:hypothetical protein
MSRYISRQMYLGDGVYVEFDDQGVILTTQDGIEVTNRIVLESEVLAAFWSWFESLKAASSARKGAP